MSRVKPAGNVSFPARQAAGWVLLPSRIIMKFYSLCTIIAAVFLSACSSGHFSSGVKTVSVNTATKRGVVLLAPDKANLFATMARERNGWLESQLRTSIQRELGQSARFQPGQAGADGEVAFIALRHGLLEVSANNYAAQVIAEVELRRGGKVVGNRELTATAGDLHSLNDFEDSKIYEAALTNAADKVALELVNDL